MPKPEQVVYAHYWQGKPFHIGSGTRVRAHDFARPLAWAKVTGGEKPEVRILHAVKTKAQALRLERKLQEEQGVPRTRQLFSRTYDTARAKSLRGRFVVYEHYSPTTGLLFYIGSGEYKRAHTLCRTLDWNKIAIREGGEPIVRIAHTVKTRPEARRIEDELISRFRPEANIFGTPEWRERQATAMKSPEYSRRQSAALLSSKKFQSVMKSLAHRKRLSAAFALPEVKARMSAAAKITLSRPEVRARISAAVKIAMNRPEVKARLSFAQKIVHSRPEVRTKCSIVQKEVQARRRGNKLPYDGGRNVSVAPGVYFQGGRYKAACRRQGKWIVIGYFPTLNKAVKALAAFVRNYVKNLKQERKAS